MNDAHLFHVTYEMPENGYLLRKVTAPCPYSGVTTVTWVVRERETHTKRREFETEEQARQWCREQAGRRAA